MKFIITTFFALVLLAGFAPSFASTTVDGMSMHEHSVAHSLSIEKVNCCDQSQPSCSSHCASSVGLSSLIRNNSPFISECFIPTPQTKAPQAGFYLESTRPPRV